MKKLFFALMLSTGLVQASELNVTSSNIDFVCDTLSEGMAAVFRAKKQEQDAHAYQMVLISQEVLARTQGSDNSTQKDNKAIIVANVAGAMMAREIATQRPEFSGLSEAEARSTASPMHKKCLSSPREMENLLNQTFRSLTD